MNDDDDPQARPRGVYWLPNLLTTAALFAGFYAIVAAIDLRFEYAGIAVFVAMLFDGLDGRVARWTHTESAFGKEYDSLSDMVSFGLAPAIVTYQWGVARIAEYGPLWRRLGWLVCFFYAAAAALRLARFNSRSATQDKHYFEGLPSPSAAAIVAALMWLASDQTNIGLPGLILAFLVTAFAGALMISRFAFYSFKQVAPAARVHFPRIVLVPLAFVLIFLHPSITLLVLFGGYALSAPSVWAYRKLRRRSRVVTPAPAPPATSMNRGPRAEYLAALGLETWALRRRGEAPPHAGAVAPHVPATVPASPRASTGGVAPAAAAVAVAVAAAGVATVASEREAAYDWTELRQRVAQCTRCGLCAARTKTVFGVGNPNAGWLVVGEAPGAEEDRVGEPFVGRAGQLLNSMLRAIGLAREEVYIANVLKCRPPHNRDPLPSETVQCVPYLERQIALLKPKVMLVVGRIAAQNLLRTDVALGRLRQQVHTYGADRVPLVVTYHPAYLLRSPADKRKAWEDLQFAREVFSRG